MPDIRDVYAECDELDLPTLHTRREAILANCPRHEGTSEPDYQKLDDDSLSELAAINRSLRKKIAANSGRARATASPRKKADITELL